MAIDGGRVAARGFQYQYLRTVEALLAGMQQGEATACRVEGPGNAVSVHHVDSVDFDLINASGRSLLAVQVKSAGAGRTARAREAVSVLVHLVTGFEADQYRLITSAVPDEGCLHLHELLKRHGGDVPRLKVGLQELLARAPAAWGLCQALSAEHWERLGRSGIEFDARSDEQLREDLHSALRLERERAGRGLSGQSGGLVLGCLVAEVMRRAADPGLAQWDVSDFRRSVLVGDEELRTALGRQDLGIVFGQVPPVPEVDRAHLVEKVGEVLLGGHDSAQSVRTCVITGLSGLGKSSLAAAYIAAEAFRYDAVFWVDAESQESLVASFVRMLAHLTGSAEQTEVRDPRLICERVHAELQSLPGRWLMVLDDASASVAGAWIPRRGHGRVIVTALGGHWPRTDGLIGLEPMSREEALELLQLRLSVGAQQATEQASVLSQLADVLEHWPLAIEVACGYLVSCGVGVERIAAYTETLVHRAADDAQSVPAGYPRTLAAAVALTMERLISGAQGRGLLQPTLNTVAALCWLAPRRAPVHLAAACAFYEPENMPPSPRWLVFDETQIPIREVMRELLNVSLVRWDEPLPARGESVPGSEDTVSMNAVLQQIIARYLGMTGEEVAAALSVLAFHSDRWLRGALLTGQAERSWELAQHATALVGHIHSAGTADTFTALLMGNLAAFHHAHGQYESAQRLLELELEWLVQAGNPDEGMAAQARTSLAHLVQLRKQDGAAVRMTHYLGPVLAYLRRLDGRLHDNVADLPAQASLILQMQLRREADPGLEELLKGFRSLADGLPSPEREHTVQGLLAIQDLIRQGEAERAERAAAKALASCADPWASSTADFRRLLVEALVLQEKWDEADAAFTDFLPYAGPHTLHGFAVHHLVHNVGCQGAWKWVLTGEQHAVQLLGRLLKETCITENPAYETGTDEARFILLQAVYDGWRAVHEGAKEAAPLRLLARLRDKTFTDPHDPGSVWERILQGLIPRLSAVAGETAHRLQQEASEAVLAEFSPMLQANEDLRAAYEEAGCYSVLSLSTDPVYGILAGRSTVDILLPEIQKLLPTSRALAILQPHQMLGATSSDNGESVELQIHRACDKGLRRLIGPQPTIPSPKHLTLTVAGQRLTLEHDDGTVIARANATASGRWRQAARNRGSALVLYGYGLALHDPPAHRQLMTAPPEVHHRIAEASDNGLLAAALVSVRIQPGATVPEAAATAVRRQPSRTARAQRKGHRR
ncbi:NB-ARC domain-containing protein [Streptomyces sp. NPDC002418]|uniref:NB-ARC domain-containing protein n=1 Tax=unclassified Streptomyces TaxID=2593676 RepID=UPI00131A17BC|nr:NB-ARC domain-containing protein [Streptomyces sp. PAMC 26508]